jgi:hypothetical protein
MSFSPPVLLLAAILPATKDLIPTSTDRNRSDRVWGQFSNEQLAGRYDLSFKTCASAELSKNTAFVGQHRLGGALPAIPDRTIRRVFVD